MSNKEMLKFLIQKNINHTKNKIGTVILIYERCYGIMPLIHGRILFLDFPYECVKVNVISVKIFINLYM